MAEEKLTKKMRDLERRATKGRGETDIVRFSLPVWENRFRAAPNEVLRSAVFNVGGRQVKRQTFNNRELAILGGGVLQQTGPELRQDDEDVWLQLMHWAREEPLGTIIECTGRELLNALGWHANGANYTRLRGCLLRLQGTAISVHCRRLNTGITVNLIRKHRWQGDDWQIFIEPEMHYLFGTNAYTKMEWEQRLKLGPVAKWLHGFYASHARPYPMKVETLHTACGSKTKDPYKFRQMLRSALNELVEVGFLKEARIEKNMVIVERKTPPAVL